MRRLALTLATVLSAGCAQITASKPTSTVTRDTPRPVVVATPRVTPRPTPRPKRPGRLGAAGPLRWDGTVRLGDEVTGTIRVINRGERPIRIRLWVNPDDGLLFLGCRPICTQDASLGSAVGLRWGILDPGERRTVTVIFQAQKLGILWWHVELDHDADGEVFDGGTYWELDTRVLL